MRMPRTAPRTTATMTTARRALLLLAITAGMASAGLGCGDDLAPAAPCVPAPGHICTLAGTGVAGDGADGQLALRTRLYLPQDATVGPDGRLYVVDWNNHRIRAISDDGRMAIVAGEGELGLDSDDPATGRLNHPTDVVFSPDGRMVIAAWHNSKVKTVDLATGEILDTCGNGKRGFSGNGGPAATATLDLPVGVVFTASGDLLISDQANQMIRSVSAETGVIQTIAGKGHCADSVNPEPCFLGDDGPAIDATFRFPLGQMAQPGGRIALDAEGRIYVADTGNYRVRRIDTDGTITTFAGTGQPGYAGDGGPAAEARLGRLSDVAVGADGTVYIADTSNSCVRMVTTDGVMLTFAGRCGERGFAGDHGAATGALLDRPYGVAVGPTGDVYIADTHNNRVRVVFR